jgi:hypothetical protein
MWVRVLSCIVVSQVSQGGLGALRLTKAMLRLLAQFTLAAYTSARWLHNLLPYDGMLRWLTDALRTVALPDCSIPWQVRMPLLVILRRTYVLARLSPENTLPSGGCDLTAQSLGSVGGLPIHLSMR